MDTDFFAAMRGTTISMNSIIGRAMGGPLECLFITQIAFHSDSEGSAVAMTYAAWEEEALLTRSQVDRLRSTLSAKGLLSFERIGSPPIVHYTLNRPAIEVAIQDVGNLHLKMQETDILRCRKPTPSPYEDREDPERAGRAGTHTRAHAREDHTDTAFEVPEWLTILREADTYSVTQAQEATLIANVAKHGVSVDRAVETANSLTSQWPYKKHKRIDLTFMNWAKGSRNGRAWGDD